MQLFLVRCHDRSYGFRVVGIIADTEENAKEICRRRWRMLFEEGDNWRRGKAEIEDSANVENGAFVEFEFEE